MARFPIPFTLPGLHEGRAATIPAPSIRMLVLSFCMVLVGTLGGLALSMQWRGGGTGVQGLTRQSSDRAAVAQAITRLDGEASDLKHQIGDLHAQLTDLQSAAAKNKSDLGEIGDTLNRERVTAGLMELQGQGVVAGFRDSVSPSVNPNDDPANYILHDYDVRDILNTLWAAGAEAVAVNGERILVGTPVYCVGSTIVCNTTRLSPPYVVTAIGNPDDLEGALRSSAQMEALNQRSLVYDLPIDIQKQANVHVPAYDGSYVFHFAHIGDAGH